MVSSTGMGLRNPWRFSFDSGDDSLWIGDVGQNRRDEVNNVPLKPRKTAETSAGRAGKGSTSTASSTHRESSLAGRLAQPYRQTSDAALEFLVLGDVDDHGA